MLYPRREFIGRLASLAVMGVVAPDVIAKNLSANKIKVLAFDAFPIFDPRSVFALAEELFPGKGQELSIAWRSRQFEYQWLRVLTGRYMDFKTVTQDALVYAAKSLKVELTDEKRLMLVDAWSGLKIWPDVLPALQSFKSSGIKLVFLSNMTEKMLRQNIQNNGLDELFDAVFSTDSIHSYKPDPAAYQVAIDKLKIKKSEIGFVAFAGWDASGSKSFGYPVFWINRQNQVNEELGVLPDWIGNNLNDLVKYLHIQ